MAAHCFLVSFFLFLFLIHDGDGTDDFSEELLIRNLPTNHAYFTFQFVTTWHMPYESAFEDYNLFPKALGDVLAVYNVRELHMSMTQGLWRHDKWGYPVVDAPPGAELWVWFNNDTNSVNQRWRQLTHTLSGLFCASLNFMDSKSTVSPKWSYRPAGLDIGSSQPDRDFLKYSALPRELVCTENLTPWKKLLPCDSKAGLARLFNAIKLYDSDYHSLGIHFRPVCRNEICYEMSLELSLSLSVVFNPSRLFSSTLPNWSLKRLFGRSLTGKCPLASTSKVYIDVGNQTQMTINPQPLTTIPDVYSEREIGVYDLSQYKDGLNIEVKHTAGVVRNELVTRPLTAHRFSTGYGLESGGIRCHLHNNLDTPLTVIYMESLPWFIRVLYNTLSVSSQGTPLKPSHTHYEQARDRTQPYLIELILTLPPNSITTISFDFQRSFLKWTEYPPDANHGFYINSAVISTILPDTTDYGLMQQKSAHLANLYTNSTMRQFLRLHTEILLISLPTPDFSMPYNVICLTCTVVAIAFGSIHNITTREFRAMDPNRAKSGLVAKIKQFFVSRLKKNKIDKDSDKGNEDKGEEDNQDKCDEGTSE